MKYIGFTVAVAGLSVAAIAWAQSPPEPPTLTSPEIPLAASVYEPSIDNPPCASGDELFKPEFVRDRVKQAVDAWTGIPVGTVAEKIAPGLFGHLLHQGGIEGKAVCAEACITVPQGAIVEACMAESDSTGKKCTGGGLSDNDGPIQFSHIVNVRTIIQYKGLKTMCAVGKQWSHNRSRIYWLRAWY